MLVLSYGQYFILILWKENMKTLVVNNILKVHLFMKCIFHMHELYYITKKNSIT